jgi:hypothetical protein
VNQSASEVSRLPPLAAQLGYAGLIPFVALSIGMWVLPEAYQDQASAALLAYAAIILSFMGAAHWGIAIAGEKVDSWQLGLSVIPALIAWFASFASPMINYSILIVAFAGLCVYDGRMVKQGKAPAWYPKLRTPLTAVVVASLILAELSLL